LFVPPEAQLDISGRDLYGPDEFPSLYRVSVTHPDRISPYHHHCLKRSVSRYEVIQEIGRKGCWVRLIPETGRKHQLRVHCAQVLKSPILCDLKYGETNFKTLHNRGWGQVLDFTKYWGMKSYENGVPMFLHMRQLRIKNYFKYLGDGGKGVEDEVEGQKRGRECYQNGDLVLTAGLPDLWKGLMKQCNLDYSIKA
jgi:23S rRNA-/tRNA-specific pseudouridylate synthase